MKFLTARKLWENGTFVGECATEFPIPCDYIAGNSPRFGWLVPVGGCCGSTGSYQLTTAEPNPAATVEASDALNIAAGILKGVWIETGFGQGALWDVLTVESVLDGCNACCDSEDPIALTGRYEGTFPTVADIEPTTFTVVREDENSVLALNRARLDYLGQHIEGTFTRASYNAGTGESTYTFQARGDAHAIGGDTITETARTFDSNSVAAGGAGNHYTLQATINGTVHTLFENDSYDTVALLATALNADGTFGAYGTWSAFSVSVLRLTSTSVTVASLVIANVAD